MIRRSLGAPPCEQPEGYENDANEKNKQRGFFEPGDKRHRDREKQAGNAKLPGSQVQPRDEDAQREQRQKHASQCITGDQTPRAVAERIESRGIPESAF